MDKGFSSMLPRLQRQKGLFMYLCYEKYGMQQAHACCMHARLAHATRTARCEKFDFSSLLLNILLFGCQT